MNLRDEFEKLFVHKGESCADLPDKWAWTIRGIFPIEVWSWLEQKVAEAQAETVERCAALVDEIGKRYRWDIPAGATADEIRALSPDPHARERWELEARLETAERIEGLCIAKTIADAKTLHDYIADLRRRRDADRNK